MQNEELFTLFHTIFIVNHQWCDLLLRVSFSRTELRNFIWKICLPSMPVNYVDCWRYYPYRAYWRYWCAQRHRQHRSRHTNAIWKPFFIRCAGMKTNWSRAQGKKQKIWIEIDEITSVSCLDDFQCHQMPSNVWLRMKNKLRENINSKLKNVKSACK